MQDPCCPEDDIGQRTRSAPIKKLPKKRLLGVRDVLKTLNLVLPGGCMFDKKAIDKCTALSSDEKVAVLTQLLYAGVHPEDFVLASALVLVPERLEELAAKLEDFAANPTPIPPVFSKPMRPTPA
jgi:hypothetical protein